LCSINVAGQVLDLETEEGFLSFCKTIIRNSRFINNNHMARLGEESHIRTEPAAACLSRSGICSGQDSNTIAKDCRLVGKVLLGENIHIRQNAVIVGPTIIGNNVIIEHGAVINSSIIGPNVLVQRNQLVQNSIIKTHAHLGEGRSQSGKGKTKHLTLSINNNSKQRCFTKFELNGQQHINGMYRNWPRFSYACCIKRIADCFTAIIMLILFAPLTPFLALAVKLTSSGPVFFKDKRQGLHGKAFYCLKFRTMTFGADKIQDKLRTVSQVDGPQFKMKDDPRLTSVGRFLRDTCIDEIPQFINVLLGQMSVVGPRPSPESENTLCPYWRDARLSVRPGITGLWQVCRTRQSGKDFQEWIHFDTEYVKNLTFRMDLWICWKTAKKLIKDFVGHF
jgi:lipopolysaccharide/colanic/teichoic acid biosynthesis glycosyltransferase